MKLLSSLLLVLLVTVQVAPTPSLAADDIRHRSNLDIVDKLIVPGYQALADSADTYATTVADRCHPKRIDTNGLMLIRQSWHGVVDQWMSIEHWRFGPVEADLRRHRIWFWPDKHGRSGKQMRRLLAAADEEKLSESRFARTSAAMQALNAAERLLFAADARERLNSSPFPCAYLHASARNTRNMAQTILTEWIEAESGERALISSSLRGNDVYANTRAVSALMVKALHTQIVSIKDLKLARPMGKSAADARPKRGESWRSGREFRNLRINLKALQALYRGLMTLVAASPDGNALNAGMTEAFDAALKAIPADEPLSAMLASKDKRGRLDALKAAVTDLRNLIQADVPKALGVQLGFNSLDGD